MSFAQTQFKDSTEANNYWAKRGVIEAVYAYMNDYIVTVGETKAKDEISGKDKYYNKFINGIDSKETLPVFNEISTLLKALNSMSDLQVEKQDPDLLSELLGKLAVKKSLQKG